ncbi:hypothetical protein ACJX0J_023262, partial [Zea mays]
VLYVFWIQNIYTQICILDKKDSLFIAYTLEIVWFALGVDTTLANALVQTKFFPLHKTLGFGLWRVAVAMFLFFKLAYKILVTRVLNCFKFGDMLLQLLVGQIIGKLLIAVFMTRRTMLEMARKINMFMWIIYMQFSAHMQILGSSTFDVSQLHFTSSVYHVVLSTGNAGFSPQMIVVAFSCCVIPEGHPLFHTFVYAMSKEASCTIIINNNSPIDALYLTIT